jgi:hypothetical protein
MLIEFRPEDKQSLVFYLLLIYKYKSEIFVPENGKYFKELIEVIITPELVSEAPLLQLIKELVGWFVCESPEAVYELCSRSDLLEQEHMISLVSDMLKQWYHKKQ